LGDHVGEPEEIVGAARAQTSAARLVPPVLNVAFHELAASGSKDVRSCEIGAREAQRGDVLELITKTKCSARLVVPPTRPQSTTDVLVEKPLVHQHVERVVGRSHLNGLQGALPGGFHFLKRAQRSVDGSM